MPQQPYVFQTVASRPPPRPVGGLLPWVKRNLLDGWTNVLITLLLIALLVLALPPIVQWGVLNAVFGPDNAACRVNFGFDVHNVRPGDMFSGLDEIEQEVKKYRAMGAKPYDIPLGALIAADVDGLMMAGRCISGDFIAWH